MAAFVASKIAFALALAHCCLAQSSDIWIQGDAVNRPCSTTRDCEAEGAKCFNGQCLCLTTHVFLQGRCLPKIKPGQSECIFDEQCTAVWPRTRCVNSICQCEPSAVQVRTRDGIVCMHEYESCPFGGRDAVLRNAQGELARCEVDPRTGRMRGCRDQMHMYDCIRNSGTNTSQFFCCPNKANVCGTPSDAGLFMAPEREFVRQPIGRPLQVAPPRTQNIPFVPQTFATLPPPIRNPLLDPVDQYFPAPTSASSTGQRPWYLQRPDNARAKRQTGNFYATEKRWYYDPIVAECRRFDYRGAGGSANNFDNAGQCENFCKTTCRRGSPQFERDPDGKITQFVQRQQMCNPATGCTDPRYECQVLQPGRALCCPTVDFICSAYGGTPRRPRDGLEYDEGVFCSNDTRTVIRYYWSLARGDCAQFSYRGCSGNHNRFSTINECRAYCRQEVTNNGFGPTLLDDPLGRPRPQPPMPTLGDVKYVPTTFAPETIGG